MFHEKACMESYLFYKTLLCFMKRYIWRVSYFFIKRLTKIETSLYFMKRHVWRVSYFFIKRLTKIETSSIFLNSHQKILENLDFKFSLRKFQNLNFHFIKPYSPNSTTVIITYPCTYLYIQHICGVIIALRVCNRYAHDNYENKKS